MANKGSIAAFIGAILVSFALGYFVLPLLQPQPEINGHIRQTLKVSSDKYDELLDTGQPAYVPVDNMSILIATTGQSRLHSSFSALIYMYYDNGYIGDLYWRFVIKVEGIGNNTGFIGYQNDDVALASSITLIDTFHLEYDTPSLPAATYNVTVYWIGFTDAAGVNKIWMPNVISVDHCRELAVQETSI